MCFRFSRCGDGKFRRALNTVVWFPRFMGSTFLTHSPSRAPSSVIA